MEGVKTLGSWVQELRTEPPQYIIKHGAQNVGVQPYIATAQTASASSIVCPIQSVQTFVSKCIQWESIINMSFNITFATAVLLPDASSSNLIASATPTWTSAAPWAGVVPAQAVLTPLALPGWDWSFASNPLHRLTTNMDIIINNLVTSLPTNYVLPTLLRLLDTHENRRGATFPSKLDVAARAPSLPPGSPSNPFGAGDQPDYGGDYGNGAWPFNFVVPTTATTAFKLAQAGGANVVLNATVGGTLFSLDVTANASLIAGTVITPTTNGWYLDTTGAITTTGESSPLTPPPLNPPTYTATYGQLIWIIQGVPFITGAVYSSNASGGTISHSTVATQVGFTIQIQYKASEPLLCSPCLYTGPWNNNEGSMFGLQTITLNTTNTTPQIGRVLRQLQDSRYVHNAAYTNSTSFPPYQNMQLLINYFQPNASLHMPPRSIVNTTEFTVTPFTNNASVAAQALSGVINSGVCNFNQVPDYVIFRVAPTINGSNPDPTFLNYGDVNLHMQKLTITFDGGQGLLGAFGNVRLWQLAAKNGMQMPWLQWSGGLGYVPQNSSFATGMGITTPAVNASNSGNAFTVSSVPAIPPAYSCPMSGGEVVLAMASDIPVYESLAPGCSGNLQFYVAFTCFNQLPIPVTPALYVIGVVSGFFTTVGGQASKTTTPITQPQVLADSMAHGTSGGEHGVSDQDLRHLVGGGWWSTISNGINKIGHIAKKAHGFYENNKGAIKSVIGATRAAANHAGGLAKRARDSFADDHNETMSPNEPIGGGRYK